MGDVFSFTNNPSDNPYDILSEVTDALEALTMIFEADRAPELSDRASAGIHHMLTGCANPLMAVETLVRENICDPMHAGYQKGFALAVEEYRRGTHEGRENLLKDLGRSAPNLGGAVRAALGDGNAATPAAPTAQAA